MNGECRQWRRWVWRLLQVWKETHGWGVWARERASLKQWPLDPMLLHSLRAETFSTRIPILHYLPSEVFSSCIELPRTTFCYLSPFNQNRSIIYTFIWVNLQSWLIWFQSFPHHAQGWHSEPGAGLAVALWANKWGNLEEAWIWGLHGHGLEPATSEHQPSYPNGDSFTKTFLQWGHLFFLSAPGQLLLLPCAPWQALSARKPSIYLFSQRWPLTTIPRLKGSPRRHPRNKGSPRRFSEMTSVNWRQQVLPGLHKTAEFLYDS